MLKLEQTNHEYYCECWENNRHQEFQSWKEFKAELPYDKDYNLLFRFDLNYIDDPEDDYYNTYVLQLHHALQRHGSEQWHVVIHNIIEQDLEEINQFLKAAKKDLLILWQEIDN